jgi:hypothetical protein
MNEEQLQQLRELLAKATAQARAVMLAVLRQIRRITAPVAAAWSRYAIERWERVRAFLANHPDLREFDAWLDRWYSFGAA